MHTNITLDGGVLRTVIVREEDEAPLSKSRWQDAVRPAIGVLRSLGGGSLCVLHPPPGS